MATQIPYSPVPTVEPTLSGTGATYGNVPEANPNAFGGQIGEAEQNAGQQTDKLAQHFADIYNQSTARDATTKTAQDISDAENRFHQLKGNDAVAGLKPFQDELKTIVKNNSQGLSLVGSQLYQGDAAYLVNSSSIRAGIHAGDQADQANLTSMDAAMANKVNQFAMTPDPRQRASLLQGIQNDALSYAHFKGVADSKVADQLVTRNIGTAYSGAIHTMLATDPRGAQAMFNEAVTGGITKPDGTVVPLLDVAQRAQLTTAIDSHQYTNLIKNVTLTQRQDVLADRQLKDSQNQNFAKETAGIISGSPIDNGRLSQLVSSQQITPEQSQAIMKTYAEMNTPKTAAKDQTQPEAYLQLQNSIYSGTANANDIAKAQNRGSINGAQASILSQSLDKISQNPPDSANQQLLGSLMKSVVPDIGALSNMPMQQAQAMKTARDVQMEWAKRVTVGGENPQNVFTDMANKYQYPAGHPENWPAPVYGRITSMEDAQKVIQQTKTAYAAGQITQQQYLDQGSLIRHYVDFYTAMPQGYKTKPRIVTSPSDEGQ